MVYTWYSHIIHDNTWIIIVLTRLYGIIMYSHSMLAQYTEECSISVIFLHPSSFIMDLFPSPVVPVCNIYIYLIIYTYIHEYIYIYIHLVIIYIYEYIYYIGHIKSYKHVCINHFEHGMHIQVWCTPELSPYPSWYAWRPRSSLDLRLWCQHG